jgi:hypothetical protein
MKMGHLSTQKRWLHTYHAKAKTVVSVSRNGATNEVAQGRDT